MRVHVLYKCFYSIFKCLASNDVLCYVLSYLILSYLILSYLICERGGGSIRVCVCMFLLFFVGVGLFVFCGGKLFCGKRGVGGEG